MVYELRALDAQDGCGSLGLGDATLIPLKTFLRKEAKKLHQENLVKTFVLVENHFMHSGVSAAIWHINVG